MAVKPLALGTMMITRKMNGVDGAIGCEDDGDQTNEDDGVSGDRPTERRKIE